MAFLACMVFYQWDETTRFPNMDRWWDARGWPIFLIVIVILIMAAMGTGLVTGH